MFAGLDLAGKNKNPSGFCIINDKIKLKTLNNNTEILKEIGKNKIEILAIDAPLTNCNKPLRKSDKLLKKRGFKPLSLSFPAMQMLSNRGISIRDCINTDKIDVIETFPRAIEKILNKNKDKIKRKYECSDHEYDAYLCALCSKYFYKGKAEVLNNEIVIPKK